MNIREATHQLMETMILAGDLRFSSIRCSLTAMMTIIEITEQILGGEILRQIRTNMRSRMEPMTFGLG